MLLPLLTVALLTAGEPAALEVPVGITDLLDDAACTVGFQHFDQPEQVLGWRWEGFDPDSGVYFVPETSDTGRSVFMHCTWRPGPGISFADFPLRLPQVGRVRLDLKCALRESAPNSDGVEYSVKVGGQTLWSTFGAWKTWHDFSVDLSEYAGRTITLRIEVGPGPAHSPTDDWSLWGKLELVAGSDAEIEAARQRRAEADRAERRRDVERGAKLAEADLTPFSRADVDHPWPDTAGPVSNGLTRDGDAWQLTCRGRDEAVTYRFDPRQGLLAGLTVSVDGRAIEPAPFRGGPQVLDGEQLIDPGSSKLAQRLLSAEEQDGVLVCRYACEVPGRDDAAALTARLRTVGKSLEIAVQGQADRFAGFRVATQGAPEIYLAFTLGTTPRYHRSGVYISALADAWQSDGSSVGGSSAATTYRPLTDGHRRALRDTFYLSVSSRMEETLANVVNPPSPYLGELSHRVVMDVWGGDFASDEAWLNDLARYGVDGFLIIKHVWQRDGYDRSYPNVMPANEQMGGDAALRSLSLAAQRLGHRFNVHENFYDFYPNAEDYRAEDEALGSNGNPLIGWDRGPVAAHILKPSRLMTYARRFSPEVKRRYDCDSAYHDIMPTWSVDYDARVPEAGMIRVTHEHSKELFDYDRELYGGPVMCEASAGLLAGAFDGGCNYSLSMGALPPSAAFELLKFHPKMSNHGFGYYERWLPWGYGSGWNTYVMTDRELDQYRATEIAFGRTGFIGQQLRANTHGLVREYYLMQAFARAYTGQPVRQLAHWVETDGGSGWVDSGTASRLRQWSRVRQTYDEQVVYANLSDQPWAVADNLLPPGGTLTVGARAVAGTLLLGGQIADFATFDGLVYADARSHQWLPEEPPPPIQPSLSEWHDNGDGTFGLTVNWKVERQPELGTTIFWHFRNGGKILFQRDHPITPSPTDWQAGTTVTDTIQRQAVPADAVEVDYDIVVGVYQQGGRLRLVGNADEAAIGTLHVTREGGKVTRITIEAKPNEPPPGTYAAPYLVGANVTRQVVDFGEVATNGAVIVRPVEGGAEVIPVPIGQAMTVGLRREFERATAVGPDGREVAEPAVTRQNGKSWFELPAEAAKVVLH